MPALVSNAGQLGVVVPTIDIEAGELDLGVVCKRSIDILEGQILCLYVLLVAVLRQEAIHV